MRIDYITVVVVILMPNMAQTSDQCAAIQDTNLKLSVASRRNRTGHWALRSEIYHTEPSRVDATPREVFLDLENGRTSCADADTARLVATVTTSAAHPPDFELFPGLGYYKFYAKADTWLNSQATCAREGANLLVLNSDAETVVVKEFFARNLPITNATHTQMVHVGVHDRYEEGKWTTVLGQPLASTGYTRWYSGTPDGKTRENCGFVRKDALLDDGYCVWYHGFICETPF